MTRSSEPFSVDDVVAARTLAVALDKLVLNHPQIARQRRVAKEAAEKAGWIFDDNAGLIRPVYGHEEAMLPLKRFAPKDYEPWSDDDAKRLYESESELARLISKRHGSEPPDICAFYHELHQYAQALFNMLTSGEVEVYCHNAHSYGYEPISGAAWIREELYVLPRKGDVFEALPMKMKLRWKAIELRAVANSQSAVAVKTSSAARAPAAARRAPKRVAVEIAISKLDLSPGQIIELGASQIYGLIHPQVGHLYPNTVRGADALRTEIKRVVGKLKKERPAVVGLVTRRLRK